MNNVKYDIAYKLHFSISNIASKIADVKNVTVNQSIVFLNLNSYKVS